MIRSPPPRAPQVRPRTGHTRHLLTSAPWQATAVKTVYSATPDSAMSGHAHLGHAGDPDPPPTGCHQGPRRLGVPVGWRHASSHQDPLVAAADDGWLVTECVRSRAHLPAVISSPPEWLVHGLSRPERVDLRAGSCMFTPHADVGCCRAHEWQPEFGHALRHGEDVAAGSP
jgi:hypothetical protein